MGFEFFDEPQQAQWQFEILERSRPDIRLTDALQWNLLELPKADRLLAIAGRDTSSLAAWITFFQHAQDEAIMKTITHPPAQRALEKLKGLSADELDRHNALLRDLAMLDEAAFASDAREKGRAEGLAEGREEGREQGREEGREEGLQEAARTFARRLITQLGLDDAAIARLTGLSEEDVKGLRQPPTAFQPHG